MVPNKISRHFGHLMSAVKRKHTLETGFSMLEAVVVVGVLLALAVGGFFAYGPITQNAKLAKVKSAASQVHTAVLVSHIDGDPLTSPADVIAKFNASNDTIKVEILESTPTPAAMTVSASAPSSDEDFCIQATNLKDTSIQAKSGKCEDAVSASPAGDLPAEVAPEPVLPVDSSSPHVDILKNGDFSEGLTYWDKVGNTAVASTVSSGVAKIAADYRGTGGLSQTIRIPNDGVTHAGYSYAIPMSSRVSTFTVSTYDPSGNLIKEIKQYSLAANAAAVPMTAATVDLTEFAGQDVKVAFQYYNGGGNGIQLSLDNTSIVTN